MSDGSCDGWCLLSVTPMPRPVLRVLPVLTFLIFMDLTLTIMIIMIIIIILIITLFHRYGNCNTKRLGNPKFIQLLSGGGTMWTQVAWLLNCALHHFTLLALAGLTEAEEEEERGGGRYGPEDVAEGLGSSLVWTPGGFWSPRSDPILFLF